MAGMRGYTMSVDKDLTIRLVEFLFKIEREQRKQILKQSIEKIKIDLKLMEKNKFEIQRRKLREEIEKELERLFELI